MKKLTFATLVLASSLSFAQGEYICYVAQSKFELRADEHLSNLVITERQTGEYLYYGFVDNVETDTTFKKYSFGKLTLTFKKSDMDGNSYKMFGFVDGTYGRGFFRSQSLTCTLNNR